MEIKFRGIDVATNQYVYGDLAHVNTFIRNQVTFQPYIVEVWRAGGMFYIKKKHKVTLESVEQLVGYNENGQEVYESIFDYNP